MPGHHAPALLCDEAEGDSYVRVAFLGLGIMGSGMAANLVKAKHEVSTWTRSGKTVSGAQSFATPAEAVRGVDVVWICVSDTAAVESVLFGMEGIESALQPGTI